MKGRLLGDTRVVFQCYHSGHDAKDILAGAILS